MSEDNDDLGLDEVVGLDDLQSGYKSWKDAYMASESETDQNMNLSSASPPVGWSLV
jgi:hypothetical protein